MHINIYVYIHIVTCDTHFICLLQNKHCNLYFSNSLIKHKTSDNASLEEVT